MSKKYMILNNKVNIKDSNGNYLYLHLDKEATKDYFLNYVNKNTVFFHDLKEKLDYMIDHKYYDPEFLNKYSFHNIKNLFKYVYSKKFRFKSFTSASKFYDGYALKDTEDNKILERYEDRISIVALYIADGDIQEAFNYAKIMINQEYQPATPTFLNSGKLKAGELVSCFLLETDDSLNSIGYVQTSSMKLSALGGGVGINLSKLRGRGDAIKGISNRASGIMPVAKILEDTFSYANQLGMRDGAGAVYLNIFHSDVEEFLSSKKVNADEKVRLKTLSIGLIIPDKFYDICKNKEQVLHLFYPETVYKEYGIHLDDMNMSEMYDVLMDNPNVKKKVVDKMKLLTTIVDIQFQSGYPYLFFKDNANRVHPLKDIGSINFSNICTEIAQLSEITSIKDDVYSTGENFKRDINCVLGSLNIANVMENKSIKDTVGHSIRMLNKVSKLTNIVQVPSIKKANDELHSIGLGAMNLHGFFVKNGIDYESEEAKDFCNVFFAMVNYYSLRESMLIAREKDETFKDFDKSEYAKGTYFDKYIEKDFTPETDKIKEVFGDIYIPYTTDWKKLKEDVMKYGLYNSYRLAIAPNQSTGYLMNATPSLTPVSKVVEVREYGTSKTIYPMPYLDNENKHLYKSAYDIDIYKYLDLMRVCQEHIDQAISITLHVDTEKYSIADVIKMQIYSHNIGLKSLYYIRTIFKKLMGEETIIQTNNVDTCESCMV